MALPSNMTSPPYEIALWWDNEWLPSHQIPDKLASFISKNQPTKYEEDFNSSTAAIKLPVWLKFDQVTNKYIIIAMSDLDITTIESWGGYDGMVQIGWITVGRVELAGCLGMKRLSKKSIEESKKFILSNFHRNILS